MGKGGHIRTVPVPEWVKTAVDQWEMAAGESIPVRCFVRSTKWENSGGELHSESDLGDREAELLRIVASSPWHLMI